MRRSYPWLIITAQSLSWCTDTDLSPEVRTFLDRYLVSTDWSEAGVVSWWSPTGSNLAGKHSADPHRHQPPVSGLKTSECDQDGSDQPGGVWLEAGGGEVCGEVCVRLAFSWRPGWGGRGGAGLAGLAAIFTGDRICRLGLAAYQSRDHQIRSALILSYIRPAYFRNKYAPTRE